LPADQARDRATGEACERDERGRAEIAFELVLALAEQHVAGE
jgi:hypothetical protein